MSSIYSTKATAIGGRSGSVRTDDGLLDVKLALPPALGGKGGATNPEQLFAAGYAACFGNAVIHTTRARAARVKDDAIHVTAEVGMGPDSKGGFALSITLDVLIFGQDQEAAEEIVRAAHAVCPYSNAIKGNIEVKFRVSTDHDQQAQNPWY